MRPRHQLSPLGLGVPGVGSAHSVLRGLRDRGSSRSRRSSVEVMDAFIIDAVRSPIGRKNGTLSVMRGDDLAAQVLNGLVGRHDLDPAEVEDVQMGCVTQIGEQAWNIGRMAVMAAGWPVEVCGSPSIGSVGRRCRRTSTARLR